MPLGVVELELAANPLNGQSRFSRASLKAPVVADTSAPPHLVL